MLSRNSIPNSCTASNSHTVSNSCTASSNRMPSQMVAAFLSNLTIPNSSQCSSMSRCTVLEKTGSVRFRVRRSVCLPNQLRDSNQIAYWKHGAYHHADPPLSAGRHSLRGQLSLRWSTRLVMVNSAWGLDTAYDQKQLATRPPMIRELSFIFLNNM
ncbi:hypothetical protein F511_11762 [Dorcoceras hygrometricum]|uniref:Uncharacterized protein n=1 Tax=Dorcoceras hygrometricum TaxID=472368 RepID=A0A2Z7CDP4_9LAMI|nr:hypothetical protein F511_11762 [Dorcoceras hygrometricum]